MIKMCTYYKCAIVLSYGCFLSFPPGSKNPDQHWFFLWTDWQLPTCDTDTINFFFLWICLNCTSADVHTFSTETKFGQKMILCQKLIIHLLPAILQWEYLSPRNCPHIQFKVQSLVYQIRITQNGELPHLLS